MKPFAHLHQWYSLNKYVRLILPSSAKPKLEAIASVSAEISFIFDFIMPPTPGKVPKLSYICIPNLNGNSMKDDLNGRRPQWKTTSMETASKEEDLNGRWHWWKMTSMEEDQNGRHPQLRTTTMEDDLNGRQPQWNTTSMEDELNGIWPQWKLANFELSLAQLSPSFFCINVVEAK